MMNALATFKERHGHGNVPFRYRENRQLGLWLFSMRKQYRSGNLNRRQSGQLKKAGVTWAPFEQKWQQMYSALVEYKRKHGNCNVPHSCPENPQLGRWVFGQRNRRKRGRLEADRIEQLDALGFVWGDRAARWEAMYTALAQYQRKHGHCKVSTLSKTRLSFWVKAQRAAKRRGKLNAEQVRRLNLLGFAWRMDTWEGRRLNEKATRRTAPDDRL